MPDIPSPPPDRALQRALITGSGGFTGRHLAEYLLAQGLAVVGLDRVGVDWSLNDRGEIHTYKIDLQDRETTAQVIREISPDVVFHLAGLTRSDNVGDLFAANVVSTDNLLQAVRALPQATRVKVFVPGSAAEYGIPGLGDLPLNEDHPLSPVSAYGVSKAAQTMLARSYYLACGLQVFIGRPFNLIGPGEQPTMLCASLAAQIAASEAGLQEPVLSVGNLSPSRDFVDIRDVVAAYWSIVTQGVPGQVYNIASGSPVAVRELLDLLVGLASIPLAVHVDASRVRPVDVPVSVGDARRLTAQTGWRPTIPLSQTVFDVLEEWRREIRGRQQGKTAHLSAGSASAGPT